MASQIVRKAGQQRGQFIANSRIKTREKKKKWKLLERQNEYGFADGTPYQAIKNIIEKEKKIRGEKVL